MAFSKGSLFMRVRSKGFRKKNYAYKLVKLLTLLDDVRQVVDPAHCLQLHAGHILQAAHPAQDDVVLLQVVPDAGDVGHHLLAGGEAHQDALSVGRVRFLGLLDEGLQDDALGEGLPVQGLAWRTFLYVRSGAVHLLERGHASQSGLIAVVDGWKIE